MICDFCFRILLDLQNVFSSRCHCGRCRCAFSSEGLRERMEIEQTLQALAVSELSHIFRGRWLLRNPTFLSAAISVLHTSLLWQKNGNYSPIFLLHSCTFANFMASWASCISFLLALYAFSLVFFNASTSSELQLNIYHHINEKSGPDRC